jgi:hypothetical protein
MHACFTKYLQFSFFAPAAQFSASSNKTPRRSREQIIYRFLALAKGLLYGSDTAGPVGQIPMEVSISLSAADFSNLNLCFRIGNSCRTEEPNVRNSVGPQASHLEFHIGPQNIDCLENHFVPSWCMSSAMKESVYSVV